MADLKSGGLGSALDLPRIVIAHPPMGATIAPTGGTNQPPLVDVSLRIEIDDPRGFDAWTTAGSLTAACVTLEEVGGAGAGTHVEDALYACWPIDAGTMRFANVPPGEYR